MGCAGIKKTGFRGMPPFLSLSTALIATPRRGFLAPAGATQLSPLKVMGAAITGVMAVMAGCS